MATLMIDVDRFKSINDRCGHDGGDQVFVAIAGTLKRHIREKDVLARVGGEEFMVLLDSSSNGDTTTARFGGRPLNLANVIRKAARCLFVDTVTGRGTTHSRQWTSDVSSCRF